MKRLHFLLVAALAVSTLTAKADVNAPVISNYGYKNLTYIENLIPNYTYVTVREQILEGDTFHTMWVSNTENESGAQVYSLWYRRSNDLGTTWEEPVLVDDSLDYVEECSSYMQVSDGTIHMIANSKRGGDILVYYRSTDGVNFEKKELGSEQTISSFQIKAVGQKIVIAYYGYVSQKVSVFESEDGGDTFSYMPVVTCNVGYANWEPLQDMAFDGNRIAILYTFHNGLISLFTANFGENFKQNDLSIPYKDDEDNTIYKSRTLYWWRNSSIVHHAPQIALDGDKIYTVFLDVTDPETDARHPVLARSFDGGDTWEPLVKISDENFDRNGTILVRGDNVYFTGQESGGGKVMYSHDGGNTFQLQNIWQRHIYRFIGNGGYELFVDDNDPTGKTVYLLSSRAFAVKSTDGFETVDELIFAYDIDDCGLQLFVDNTGRRHWFHTAIDHGEKYVSNVNYRREGDDPEPAAEDAAIHFWNLDYNKPLQLVIPNTATSTPEEEITVELWASIYEDSGQFLWSHYDSYERPAIKIGVSGHSWGTCGFYAEISNGDDNANIGFSDYPTDEFKGYWHHLAVTYSASAGKFMIYIDGVLMDSADMTGKLDFCKSPIYLGPDYSDSDYAMDEVRIWNRALSADEIKAHFQNKLVIANTEGLGVRYSFDQTLADGSGNGISAIPTRDVTFVDSAVAGISSAKASKKTDAEYDLQGRRTNGNAKGIVITDGKKVLK